MSAGRVFVDASTLAAWLAAAGSGDGPQVRLVDVRWSLGRDDGREQYLAGHLPGAVFADLDSELAAPPTREGGRHPLPPFGQVQIAARRWGVNTGDRVVAYDAGGGTVAARAWWLLRWAGLREVFLLDGGLAAWRGADQPLATAPVEPVPGDVVLLGPGHMPTLDADAAQALARRGILLDVRAHERYRGEVEPVDPRAGHIPGAHSAPTTDLLGADARLRPEHDLRAFFAEYGIDGSAPVGAYCGSGINAAHTVAVLADLGLSASLYPGSWSQWAGDPQRPAATGG